MSLAKGVPAFLPPHALSVPECRRPLLSPCRCQTRFGVLMSKATMRASHAVLLAPVRERIDDPIVMDLIGQYLYRTVDDNRLYITITRGISLGCPLSPVKAAIYLEPLDRRMDATGFAYARFMDDWVVLAPTRWALRRAIVIINETLRELRVEQHPDKTSIGRIERGFTFLGYWITAEGVTGVAPSAVRNFEERKARLYGQNAPPEVIRERVELYVRRWRQWVLAGVREASAWPSPESLLRGISVVASMTRTLHRPIRLARVT